MQKFKMEVCGNPVRYALDDHGLIWLVARDVFRALNSREWAERTFRKVPQWLKKDEPSGLTLMRFECVQLMMTPEHMTRYDSLRLGELVQKSLEIAVPSLYRKLRGKEKKVKVPEKPINLRYLIQQCAVPTHHAMTTFKQVFSRLKGAGDVFTPGNWLFQRGFLVEGIDGFKVSPGGFHCFAEILGVKVTK